MAKGHVRLGGSKAHRWLACPASPRLEEEAGPQGSNDAADLGTAAHELLETALHMNRNPNDALGKSIKVERDGEAPKEFEVDRDMAEAVEVAWKWVQNVKATASDAVVLLEQRVNLESLNPPEPMSGSADVIVLIPSLRLMIVFDYKHGKGKVVEVTGNKQTRYYALGALLSLTPEQVAGIDKVQMVIAQPRAYHPMGPVRSETVDINELLDFAADIVDAANAAQDPKAPAIPGDHCVFCAAAGSCPARADRALAVAQEEFTVITDFGKGEKLTHRSNDEITAALAVVQPKLAILASWVKEAEALLYARAVSGQEIPGMKLVPKRATRVWTNLEEVKSWALLDAGLSESDLYTAPEIQSVAQIEKLVGKKNLPANLVASVSSGYNLVSESSSKPAAKLAASDEFSTEESSNP
jgi:Protein of unknown function (DUF2800)